MLRQKLGAQENDSARLQQLLDIEKDCHSQAKDEAKALRAEHKDLMSQRARDASMVAAAEDLRKQWEHVQVWCTWTAEAARVSLFDAARFMWEQRRRALQAA
jgi:predicted HTH transcriptional regulator